MKDVIIAQIFYSVQKNCLFIKSVWINKNHFNTINSRSVLKNYFSNRSSSFDRSIVIKLRESRTINPTRLYAKNHEYKYYNNVCDDYGEKISTAEKSSIVMSITKDKKLK